MSLTNISRLSEKDIITQLSGIGEANTPTKPNTPLKE
jgi:hypothetical protein